MSTETDEKAPLSQEEAPSYEPIEATSYDKLVLLLQTFTPEALAAFDHGLGVDLGELQQGEPFATLLGEQRVGLPLSLGLTVSLVEAACDEIRTIAEEHAAAIDEIFAQARPLIETLKTNETYYPDVQSALAAAGLSEGDSEINESPDDSVEG